MFSTLSRWSPHILSAVRIVVGLLFLEHGTAKYLGFPITPHVPEILSMSGVGGLLELVGGALLTVGLFTRPVAFVLSGEMAVAYFFAHFPRSFFPMINGGDAAVLYCFVFLYLCFAGGGRWSIDALVARSATKEEERREQYAYADHGAAHHRLRNLAGQSDAGITPDDRSRHGDQRVRPVHEPAGDQ